MVLLILAGITITYVMGDNGIIKKAQETKNKVDKTIQNEQDELGELANLLKGEYSNETGGEETDPPKDKIEISTITERVDKNTLAEDNLGNSITIPEGFKVVPDGQDGVEYTYTGDKKPTVQDGIVIEDEEGNQFVWIPVGNIKNKDHTTTTITLGRYTFDDDGIETLVQNATNYASTADDTKIYTCHQELEISSYGNTTAKSLSAFVSRINSNRGYYLARYEASKGRDNKAKSKSAAAWTYITQPQAATAARGMYESANFESDLVNSYAWDTAIVFIQTYSGDSDYSIENGQTFSSSLVNTGTNGDKRCNIYDMASNAWEWTTETSINSGLPCTSRGGNYNRSNAYTSSRDNIAASFNNGNDSFRPLLYIK